MKFRGLRNIEAVPTDIAFASFNIDHMQQGQLTTTGLIIRNQVDSLKFPSEEFVCARRMVEQCLSRGAERRHI